MILTRILKALESTFHKGEKEYSDHLNDLPRATHTKWQSTDSNPVVSLLSPVLPTTPHCLSCKKSRIQGLSHGLTPIRFHSISINTGQRMTIIPSNHRTPFIYKSAPHAIIYSTHILIKICIFTLNNQPKSLILYI